MRLGLTMLVTIALAAPAVAQNVDNPLVVQVGVFNVRQDGSVGGYAVDVPERVNEPFASLVWTGGGGCRIGAIDLDRVERREPPEGASEAWELRGRVISMTGEQAEVQVDWRRVRATGSGLETGWSSRQVTVSINQLVALDDPIRTSGECALQHAVTFGARFAPRFVGPVVQRGGSAGAVSGTGTGTSRGTGGAVVGLGAGPAVLPYTAEMWLVHNVPGKAETYLPLTIRLEGGWTPFAFQPVRFSVPGGMLTVALTGSLRVVRSGQGEGLSYILTGSRAVTFTPATRPGRDPGDPRSERASFSTTKALPGSDDVIAYEMPAVTIPGGAAVPDTLTIRLRLRLVTTSN